MNKMITESRNWMAPPASIEKRVKASVEAADAHQSTNIGNTTITLNNQLERPIMGTPTARKHYISKHTTEVPEPQSRQVWSTTRITKRRKSDWTRGSREASGERKKHKDNCNSPGAQPPPQQLPLLNASQYENQSAPASGSEMPKVAGPPG